MRGPISKDAAQQHNTTNTTCVIQHAPSLTRTKHTNEDHHRGRTALTESRGVAEGQLPVADRGSQLPPPLPRDPDPDGLP